MYIFAIYTKKPELTIIGTVLKVRQFLVNKKEAHILGIRNHPALS